MAPNPHAKFYWWGYGCGYADFSGVILFFFDVFLVQFLGFLTRFFYDNGLADGGTKSAFFVLSLFGFFLFPLRSIFVFF